MGFFDVFRRPSPIRDAVALADFIDRQAAFVTQKGIYEYSRARAGHFAKVVFRESEFQEACDRARWSAYPLGLAMVAELTETVLYSPDAAVRGSRVEALRALVLGVLDRYPAPSVLGDETWSALRGELDRRLASIGLHAPKRSMDIPEPYAALYFDLMPIHKDVRSRDLPTTRNYLRVTLCNVHAELTERADIAAVVGSLTAPGACSSVGVRAESAS